MSFDPRYAAAALTLALLGAVACSDAAGTGDTNPESEVGARDATREVRNTEDSDLAADLNAEMNPDSPLDTVEGDSTEENLVAVPPVAVPGDGYDGFAGVPVELDGSGSFDVDGEIIRWEWRLGDGERDDGEIVFHTYGEPGRYVVRLTVTDDDDLEHSETVDVDIDIRNEGPTAVINGPTRVLVGVVAEYDGYDSTDDGEIVRYTWDVDVDDEELFDGVELEFAWLEYGRYTLELEIEDDLEDLDSDTLSVHVQSPPTAIIDAATEVTVGDEVQFDGTDSFDEDGEILYWDWVFPDDPTEATGPLPRHTFSSTGDLDIFLTVTDNDGLTHTTNHKLLVSPLPNRCPTAVITHEGEEPSWPTGDISLSGATSSDPDDGDSIDGYLWDWGEDTAPSLGVEPSHEYDDDGEYVVTLVVIDEEGCTYSSDDETTDSARTTLSVTITNRAPTAVLRMTPTTSEPGELVAFDATDSSDPDGEITRYRIDFDDGLFSTASSGNHSFDEDGTYEVLLTVTDADDEQDTDMVEVTIATETDNYSGQYLLSSGAVVYTCLGGFVEINFTSVCVVHADTTIQVTPLGSGRDDSPGPMLGSFDTATHFRAQQSYDDGSCRQDYVIDGTFTDATHFTASFMADFTDGTDPTWGSCTEVCIPDFGCLPPPCTDQEWPNDSGRVALSGVRAGDCP
jgi:PKD repeat protein